MMFLPKLDFPVAMLDCGLVTRVMFYVPIGSLAISPWIPSRRCPQVKTGRFNKPSDKTSEHILETSIVSQVVQPTSSTYPLGSTIHRWMPGLHQGRRPRLRSSGTGGTGGPDHGDDRRPGVIVRYVITLLK